MKASAAEAAQKHKDDTKSEGTQNYLSQKPQTVSEIFHVFVRQSGGNAEIFDTFGI